MPGGFDLEGVATSNTTLNTVPNKLLSTVHSPVFATFCLCEIIRRLSITNTKHIILLLYLMKNSLVCELVQQFLPLLQS
jgi:hypothetical protein